MKLTLGVLVLVLSACGKSGDSKSVGLQPGSSNAVYSYVPPEAQTLVTDLFSGHYNVNPPNIIRVNNGFDFSDINKTRITPECAQFDHGYQMIDFNLANQTMQSYDNSGLPSTSADPYTISTDGVYTSTQLGQFELINMPEAGRASFAVGTLILHYLGTECYAYFAPGTNW